MGSHYRYQQLQPKQFSHCPEKKFNSQKGLQNSKLKNVSNLTTEETFHWAPPEGKWLEDF